MLNITTFWRHSFNSHFPRQAG